MCILILHSWPCSFKPRVFTLSLCCVSHCPSSVVSDSGSLLMMWWPLNVQWRGLLFLYLFCSRGETDSLGQDVLSATQQAAGWVDSLSESISGARSRPVCPSCPCMSDGFYEMFLYSSSFFCLLEYRRDVAAPFLAPLFNSLSGGAGTQTWMDTCREADCSA